MAYTKRNFVDRDDGNPDSYMINGVVGTIEKDNSGLVTAGTDLDASNMGAMDTAIFNNDTLRRVLSASESGGVITVSTANAFETENNNVIKIYIATEITGSTDLTVQVDGAAALNLRNSEGDNVQELAVGLYDIIFQVGTPNFFLLAPRGGGVPFTFNEFINDTNNEAVGVIREINGVKALQQPLQNGDFSNGTTNWSSGGSTLSVSNNILSVTGDGSNAIPQVFQIETLDGSVRHYNGRVRVTNSDCQKISVFISGTEYTIIDNPIVNQWYIISEIRTVASSGSSTFVVRHTYADAATANNKVMEIDGNYGLFEFNLTSTGRQDNTESELLQLSRTIGYFEGLKVPPRQIDMLSRTRNILNLGVGSVTANGVTLVSDGETITITGTATADTRINLQNEFRFESSTPDIIALGHDVIVKNNQAHAYGSNTISGSFTGSATVTLIRPNATIYPSVTFGSIISNTIDDEIAAAYFFISNGASFTNYNLRVGIRQGTDITTTYVSYDDSTNQIIAPTEYPWIQLPNDIMNNVPRNGVFNGNVRVRTFDGSESWVLVDQDTNTIRFRLDGFNDSVSTSTETGTLISYNFLEHGSTGGVDVERYVITTNQFFVRINKSRLTTNDLAGFTALLSEDNLILAYQRSSTLQVNNSEQGYSYNNVFKTFEDGDVVINESTEIPPEIRGQSFRQDFVNIPEEVISFADVYTDTQLTLLESHQVFPGNYLHTNELVVVQDGVRRGLEALSQTQEGASGLFRFNTTSLRWGQTFVAEFTDIFSIAVRLRKQGSPTGDVTMKLYNTSSDIPTTELATSTTTLTASEISSSLQSFTFNFDSNTLTSGTKYAFVLESDDTTVSTTNYYTVSVVGVEAYTDGNPVRYTSTDTWLSDTNQDAYFIINKGVQGQPIQPLANITQESDAQVINGGPVVTEGTDNKLYLGYISREFSPELVDNIGNVPSKVLDAEGTATASSTTSFTLANGSTQSGTNFITINTSNLGFIPQYITIVPNVNSIRQISSWVRNPYYVSGSNMGNATMRSDVYNIPYNSSTMNFPVSDSGSWNWYAFGGER